MCSKSRHVSFEKRNRCGGCVYFCLFVICCVWVGFCVVFGDLFVLFLFVCLFLFVFVLFFCVVFCVGVVWFFFVWFFCSCVCVCVFLYLEIQNILQQHVFTDINVTISQCIFFPRYFAAGLMSAVAHFNSWFIDQFTLRISI